MAGLARVLERQELRVEAGQLPHARTLWLRTLGQEKWHRSPREPLRRHPSRRGACSSTSTSCTPRTAANPQGPVVVRDLGPPRHLAQGHVHRSPRPGHQRGDRAPPKSARGSPGRCSSRATRTRCRSRRSTPRSSVFSAHGHRRPRRRRRTATRRRPRSATRSSPTPAATGSCSRRSHNPPEDGGYKYNPPSGGPAGTDITKRIEDEANRAAGRPRSRPPTHARRRTTTSIAYVEDLPNVIDIDAIREAGVRIGADPLGGASASPTSRRSPTIHGLDLEVVNDEVDPTFRFVPLDHDGKIRMDCSSPYVMSGLIELRDRFDVAVACDPDADRHGIVAPSHRAAEPQPLPGGGDPVPVRRRARLGRRGDRQDARVLDDDRPRRARTSAAGWSRCRSASSGSSTGWSTARSASAARRARARRSCAATARRGRPTRTASCSRCWRRRSRPRPASDPGERYTELTAALRRAGLQAHGLADRRPSARRSCSTLEPSDITATELAGEPIEAVLTTRAGQRRARSAA